MRIRDIIFIVVTVFGLWVFFCTDCFAEPEVVYQVIAAESAGALRKSAVYFDDAIFRPTMAINTPMLRENIRREIAKRFFAQR